MTLRRIRGRIDSRHPRGWYYIVQYNMPHEIFAVLGSHRQMLRDTHRL